MAAPTVDVTRLSLSGKTIAIVVALILAVGFVLLLMWPSVSAVGHKLGDGLRRGTDKVTNQASATTSSATAGMA